MSSGMNAPVPWKAEPQLVRFLIVALSPDQMDSAGLEKARGKLDSEINIANG